jgi:hypothetical protein
VVGRCTKKMLDLLGGRSITLSELTPTDEDWYLNLLWIDRQKCLLLTHAGTLFSVFRAGVHRADLRPIGTYLVAAIETELSAENLPTDTCTDLTRPSTPPAAPTIALRCPRTFPPSVRTHRTGRASVCEPYAHRRR